MDQKLDTLIKLICRICGQDKKNCTPIFGKEHLNILMKIRACLSFLIIEKTDLYPKQVCYECLSKLESSWEFYCSSQEGQKRIENKLQTVSETDSKVENACGVCQLEVQDVDLGVGCEGHCRRWHHHACVGMTDDDYYSLAADSSTTWICNRCILLSPLRGRRQGIDISAIEERIKSLSETESISFGESAIISLAPPSPPPPPPRPPPPQPPFTGAPPVAVAPPVDVPPPSASHQQVTQAEASTEVPPSTPTPHAGTRSPGARKRTGASLPVSDGNKRRGQIGSGCSRQICKYCHKWFPDDIIDHHVDLHLRRAFYSCLDCNKNFRSEEAMGRHRCGRASSDSPPTAAFTPPIDLDGPDQPICL